jgi:hypothetical protein
MRQHATFLGVTLVIAALSLNDAAGQEPSPQQKADNTKTQQSQNPTVTRLLRTQLQAAQQAHRAATESMEVRQIGDMLVLVKGNQHARPDLVYTWSVRWLQAQRDLSVTKDQRTAAFVDHDNRMKQLREAVKTLVGDGNSGLLQASETPAAEWYLAEAELWLLKERGK